MENKSNDMKKINVNSLIKVKLTPLGVDIYYHQNDETLKSTTISETVKKYFKPRMPEIDSNGFTMFELWRFMNLYGKYFDIDMGRRDQVIQSMSIFINEEDIEDIKEK